MTRRTRRILTVLGALTAVGVVAVVTYRAARAAARPNEPRYPPGPNDATAPLRPPQPSSDDPPPGPLAARLRALVGKLDDKELAGARYAMPAHWWPLIGVATQQGDDEDFTVALEPIAADLAAWTDEQQQQLQRDLVASLGYLKALELQGILKDAGVL